jgi:hypothetical protein
MLNFIKQVKTGRIILKRKEDDQEIYNDIWCFPIYDLLRSIDYTTEQL